MVFSQFTQTERVDEVGPCNLFLSVTSDGDASTQVTHAIMTSVAIEAATEWASTAVGPDRRSCIFAGYDSLVGKSGALEELCSVSTSVFALLLHLLSSIVVRENDISIENKLLIFLLKLKLGISFTSLGVLFGVHRTTASRIFFFFCFKEPGQCHKLLGPKSVLFLGAGNYAGVLQSTLPKVPLHN